MVAMLLPPPRTLSLEPILRCPRCRRVFHASDQRSGDGFYTCQRGHCGQRWWAMVLAPGPVDPQLADAFGDLAPVLARQYGMPDLLRERMYWQLALTPHEVHVHRRAAPVALFRALLLVPALATLGGQP